jgi:hypothetical protein
LNEEEFQAILKMSRQMPQGALVEGEEYHSKHTR